MKMVVRGITSNFGAVDRDARGHRTCQVLESWGGGRKNYCRAQGKQSNPRDSSTLSCCHFCQCLLRTPIHMLPLKLVHRDTWLPPIMVLVVIMALVFWGFFCFFQLSLNGSSSFRFSLQSKAQSLQKNGGIQVTPA